MNGIPKGSRFAENPGLAALLESNKHLINDEKFKKAMKGLEQIAKEIGCTMAQLALAWTIVPEWMNCAIIGATSVKQLEENFKCFFVAERLRKDKQLCERIEKVLDNKPQQYRALSCFDALPDRR